MTSTATLTLALLGTSIARNCVLLIAGTSVSINLFVFAKALIILRDRRVGAIIE